jgi:hypothetical protein
MKSTPGEILFATVRSAFAAVLAGVLGFFGGIFLCERLFTGETTEWGLIVGPCGALVLGAIAFVFTFRKIVALMS